jgi:hypothetical protein
LHYVCLLITLSFKKIVPALDVIITRQLMDRTTSA